MEVGRFAECAKWVYIPAGDRGVTVCAENTGQRVASVICCTARPPSWGKEVADGIPNSEILLLEKVGHSPTLEVPDLVYPIILDFYDKHNS